MASLGHIAVGLAAGRAHASERPLAWMIGLSLLSLAPDLDVVAFAMGIPYEHAFGHRGASHALLVGLLGAGCALVPGPHRARAGIIGVLVLTSHGLLDAMTTGGLGAALLWPFTEARYFAPIRPIPVAPIGAGMISLRGLAPGVRDRCTVIYNGLPNSDLPAAPLSTDPPRLLCVGRLVREKGFDTAVSAFSEVRHRFSTARLSIAGDGPARPELEEEARRAGLRDAVDFLGVVPPVEIAALIAGASLVLVPSRWREPFCLVALQAAQEGRPVVATRRGGLPEVVINGETGLVVAADDPPALAGATIRLLEDPDLARKLGDRGRVRACEKFGFERFVRANHDIYCCVAAGNGAQGSGRTGH